MIDFGLIDSWNPAGGAHTRWGITDSGRARARRAPRHSVPPSHQQQAYLVAAQANQNLGFRFSRLCVVTFDMVGPLDYTAMTAAVNEFFRRHDTFRSWFRVGADGAVHRHVVDPTALQLEPRVSVEGRSGSDIRAEIEGAVPGPLDWDCFSAGVIDRDGEFTVYLAIDHLHTDGISQALSCVDLMSLYAAATDGSCDVGHGVGSYLEYCRRERVGPRS